MNQRTPRGIRFPALSFTIIASRLAPAKSISVLCQAFCACKKIENSSDWDLIPSLLYMCFFWTFTVSMEISSLRAISLLEQRQQGNLPGAEMLFAAQRQAQRADAFELTIKLDFVGRDIHTKVALIVLGEFEMLRRHFRQVIQPGARSFAAGEVKRVEQVQTAQVILK